ncbi:hypothetical protein [Gordonia caeni]|uniref:Uncharacterized protein n=1 Tax=Gordonia caeni TaxID=1007097 RepID=A0ABP7NYE4_9ACTN
MLAFPASVLQVVIAAAAALLIGDRLIGGLRLSLAGGIVGTLVIGAVVLLLVWLLLRIRPTASGWTMPVVPAVLAVPAGLAAATQLPGAVMVPNAVTWLAAIVLGVVAFVLGCRVVAALFALGAFAVLGVMMRDETARTRRARTAEIARADRAEEAFWRESGR